MTTPFDANVKLSKADLPTTEKEKALCAGTDYQVADIFTKPLAHAKFRAFREVLCGYRSYEQLLNSNEEKQAEIRQLQAYDFRLQNQISLAGHPLAHLC